LRPVGELWDSALSRLRGGRAETTLIVPLPSARPLLQVVEHGLETVASDIPPHITLMYPFVPPGKLTDGLRARLAGIFAGGQPLEFDLATLAYFPGVSYIAPEPAAPLVSLTTVLISAFPEFRPYGGQFDEIIPHLTLAMTDDLPTPVRTAISALLPHRVTADEVWLMSKTPRGQWSVVWRFPLASADVVQTPTPSDS
jgi:2'-5' RNA ligase